MIEGLITSSALIALICMIRAVFKGKISFRLQYALWLLVLLKLTIGWIPLPATGLRMESSYSIMNLAERARDLAAAQTHQTNQTPNIPQLELLTEPLQTKAAVAEDTFQRKVTLPGNWKTAILAVWAVGSTGIGIWILIVNLSFGKRLISCRSMYSHPTASFPLPVYTVPGFQFPCLYSGVGGTAIYISRELSENGEQLKHVLAHELCHYRHGDHIWQAFRCGLLALYWVNPFVWAAARLSKQDCELACDEAAVKLLGEEERIAYGRTLLDLISRQVLYSDLVSTATTMTGSEKNIRERIQMIVKKPKIMIYAMAGAAAVTAAAVMITFTGAKETAGENLEENQVQQSVVTPTTVTSVAETPTAETPAVSHSPGDIIQVINPEITAETPFGADGPNLDYASDSHIIFHDYSGLFVYDLRRQAIVRTVDLESIGCQYTQGDSYCEVTVSEDGMTATLHPINQDMMFVYQVAENTLTVQPYKELENRFQGAVYREDLVTGGGPKQFSQENIRYCPQMVRYHSGTGWDYEFYLVYTDSTLGSLVLLGTDTDGLMNARFPLFSFEQVGEGRLRQHDTGFYNAIKAEASVDALAFGNLYVKMVNSWDYAGVSALSNGQLTYSDRIQESWDTVKGSAMLSIDEEQPKRGRMSCLLELDIEDPGDTGLEKGKNLRYIYMIKDNDGWYADGPMREMKPADNWWRGVIIQDENINGGLGVKHEKRKAG